MIISLTGYMGSGKSSVGKILSGMLGFKFTDLDEYITHKKGMPVSDIIVQEGENTFRALEAECVRDVIIMSRLTGENMVLSLGGGTLTIGSVRDFILENTYCVYLKADYETLVSRIGKGTASRPLFGQKAYEERLGIYQLAEKTIDTEGKTPEIVAEEIKLFSISL